MKTDRGGGPPRINTVKQDEIVLRSVCSFSLFSHKNKTFVYLECSVVKAILKKKKNLHSAPLDNLSDKNTKGNRQLRACVPVLVRVSFRWFNCDTWCKVCRVIWFSPSVPRRGCVSELLYVTSKHPMLKAIQEAKRGSSEDAATCVGTFVTNSCSVNCFLKLLKKDYHSSTSRV